jgi:putative CocE/NonD family hydrolase
VRNGIPAYLVGGEFDIFQRGEPLNYMGLQNAWAGRSIFAPMLASQPTTGRYQLIDGPWEHLNGSSVDVDELELAWFDQWLKGIDTGIGSTPTPLHYYDLGTGAWTHTGVYPFAGAKPQRLYLGSGTLSAAKPATAGTDTLAWTGVGNPCSRPLDQWSMGAASISATAFGVTAPCADNDGPSTQNPLSSVAYTSAALKKPQRIAGPIAATLFASATSADTEWVVQVQDVAPDGTARPLTEGALLGSLRAVDRSRSWSAPGGGYLLPYHPYTQSSAVPVPTGKVVRYDVEVFPTYATIPAGHSIRVTISTADSPHLMPTVPESTHLTGGVYTLQRTPQAASYVTLNLQPVR